MNPILKWFIKAFVRFHVFRYRASGGRFGNKLRGFNVLLLTTVGRKSGKQHTVPLGFIQDGNSYVIVGSFAAFGRNPAWYLNLQHNPKVQIQVLSEVLEVTAETAQGEQRQRLWEQFVTEVPGYADYQKRTTREIPVVTLKPDAV